MSLDLPPIYLLSTNLQPDELHSLEESIPSLTWDAHEAEIVVGRITRRQRALFELRRLKLRTEELPARLHLTDSDHEQLSKRRRVSGAGDEGLTATVEAQQLGGDEAQSTSQATPADTVKVLKLSWLTDSLKQRAVLPTKDYLLYEGIKRPSAEDPNTSTSTNTSTRLVSTSRSPGISTSAPPPEARPHSRLLQTHQPSPRPALLQQTTSEHDMPLPPVPDFLHTPYSCQRPTPVDTPNAEFVGQLKEIRTHRILEGDQVGVRAYSTSIAALAAYPYPLQSSFEVSRLPGCGAKIAELYQQWKDSGSLKEVNEVAADIRMPVLKLFYNIWGVGDTTARGFYNKGVGILNVVERDFSSLLTNMAGWRDLDDLVEYGWGSLSRVQQIGVKYYDEFQHKIPRAEVEDIGHVILSHAHDVDPDFQMMIVGGYRRGKAESGDVDVVLSHPDESQTERLVEKIVIGLERSKYITHTLTMSTRNSERGQAPLPWGGEGRHGSGFDTLDKAMVVWRDPTRDNAPRRRVDIIVSPWKTVGCALLGWSGGTTFQRDLRRYCKKEKRLKFDSSGVRDRTDGSWVDLEGPDRPAPDMETAEKRVFKGLGLPWRAPEERCTG